MLVGRMMSKSFAAQVKVPEARKDTRVMLVGRMMLKCCTGKLKLAA